MTSDAFNLYSRIHKLEEKSDGIAQIRSDVVSLSRALQKIELQVTELTKTTMEATDKAVNDTRKFVRTTIIAFSVSLVGLFGATAGLAVGVMSVAEDRIESMNLQIDEMRKITTQSNLRREREKAVDSALSR